MIPPLDFDGLALLDAGLGDGPAAALLGLDNVIFALGAVAGGAADANTALFQIGFGEFAELLERFTAPAIGAAAAIGVGAACAPSLGRFFLGLCFFLFF